MPVDRLTNPQEITVALHRAVVEVYTFHQADKPLSDLSSSWDSEDLTRSVQISPSSNGQEANLFFPDQEIRAQILSSNTASQAPLPEEVEEPIEEFEEDVEEKTGAVEENQEAAESTLEESRQAETGAVEMAPLDEGFLEEAKQKHLQGLDQQIASWDRAWLSVPLTSPDIKFAVLKRTLRLTGHRISDPTISTLTTVSSLLAQLIKPPKPKKLAEILVADDKLQQLPNLQIHDRRVTPIDREKAVGRWKVIEKELTKRGLPVTGSG
ncbi:MAG: hypothetical protein M1837_001992 [Sclerophora amabilis]|nr:MAG: hypothetical protein M1837_001992 [Sclerophora amabilis]